MDNQQENFKPAKPHQLYIKLPLFVGIAFTVGMLLGATFFGANTNMKGIFLSYNKYREVLTHIDRNYVDSVDVDELVDYSIEKMLEKLDPHTAYIPVKDVKLANAQLEGDYEGIGIEFNIYKDTLYVVAPISEGPSEKAGLQAGDKIVEIDGEDIATIKIDNAGVFQRLRGKKGSEVKLGVVRGKNKDIKQYTVTRDKIPSISVYSYMIDETTGYIKITRFARNTYEEFKKALQGVKNKGAKQLMIDLRDNPGGYMDAAVKISDELIAGNEMIVYTEGKGTRFDNKERAQKDGMFEKGAIVVLINEGSASASEILSGALQDNDRALIVGRRSFGKGLVQMPIKLSDGSELRLTISRYYTPSGRSIQKSYDDNEAYQQDITERFKHGEMFTMDSIKFDEKLKYKTSKGRTVYGGGGIMPDYFIPLDTSANTTYANQLYQQNIPREFAVSYFNNNKGKFNKMKLDDFIKSFDVGDAMMQQVIKMGKDNGIEWNEEEYRRSEKMMRGHIKAYIAKAGWGNEGFYKLWYANDKLYQQGFGLFDEAKSLLKLK